MRDRSNVAGLWRRAVRFHDEHPVVTTLVASAVLSCWVYWDMLSALRTVTSTDTDAALFVWSMGHAPFRLLHGGNPFYSDSIFAVSGGANLAYNATAPLLALLMWPVTALWGPVAAFNVLTLLTPVLNTLAARRLLKVVSGAAGLSVTLGALVIGFSPLVLMHNAGRFQLIFHAVAFLLLTELWIAGTDWLDGRPTSVRRFAWIGALTGAQLWIGSEQLAIVAIVVAIALVVAVVIRHAEGSLAVARPAGHDLASIGAALGVMVIVASPFFAALLFGDERYTDHYHLPARPWFGLRIANLFTPTDANVLHSHIPLAIDRARLSVFPAEDTGYIGLFAIVALGLVMLTWRRRTAVQRGALIMAVVCWFLALGPTIRWAGNGSGLPGPWRLIEHVPVLEEIIANRLSMGLFLALGVLVATVGQSNVETARPAGRLELAERVSLWCIPLLLLPAQYQQTVGISARTERMLRERCAGALVVTMPQDLEQQAMAWQARSDFAFDLYRGFAFRSSTPPKGDRLLLDDLAEHGAGNDESTTAALDELDRLAIGCVVTPSADAGTIAHLAPVLGPPTLAGDAVVWQRS